MKKRIIATVLLLVLLVSCFSFTAAAETRRNLCHQHDKLVLSVNLLTLNFKASYNDCTKTNCYETCDLIGQKTHGVMVTNNQTGANSGWVYGVHNRTASAKIKGNWAGSGDAYYAYLGKVYKA